MKIYEITFEWPNGDWTWYRGSFVDFHAAVVDALASCPKIARVIRIELIPVK